MSVLITGAGLLGTYAAREYLGSKESVILYEVAPNYIAIKDICGEKIKIIKGDILDIKKLYSIVKKYHPKNIVHTAVIRQTAAQKDPIKAKKINIEGTKNIIEVASSIDARIIYPSSASVYGPKIITNKPIQESHKLKPASIYAKTKVASEGLVLNYSNSVILRLPGFFGPYKGKTSTGNELFKQIIEATILGQSRVINNPFKGHIEHIYIKDAASAIFLTSESKNLKNKVFNIGMGRVHTMDEVLLILKKFNPEANIKLRYIPSSIDIRNQPLDITRAKKELGYHPQFNLESGLKDYTKTLQKWIKN